MSLTRAKFKVQSLQLTVGSRRKRGPMGNWILLKDAKTGLEMPGNYVTEPCVSGQLEMRPVYANDDAQHENSKFWDASPSGEFKMSVNNMEALKGLEVGKEYYIDISEAE